MLIALVALVTVGPDFPPVDEGANNVQFAEFRRNLVHSIEKKNYDWAVARIALDIKYSFGEEGDKKELLRTWDQIPTAKEEFFALLLECLKLGGQFKKYDDRSYFVAPYVFSAWPDELDAFEHLAVVTTDAKVHEKPDEQSAVVADVGQTIVRFDHSELADGWHWIEYDQDKWAWINAKDVRSPIAHRALFRIDHRGSFMLETFLAGD